MSAEKPKVVGAVAFKDRKGEQHVFVLAVQPASKCSSCGRSEECRPYGPGGTSVCYACMQKNPEEARRQFLEQTGLNQRSESK